MKKIFTFILSLLIIIFTGVLIAGIYRFNFTDGGDNITSTSTPLSDVKNSSYKIDEELFTLKNGTVSKELAPGSASKQTVSIFGEPVYGDLNKDGVKDAAVMLASNSGGSGTFYYAVLAIATGSSYTTTNSLLLGDRIAPQTVEIQDGRAIYNYAERRATDPMTTQPSMGKSLYIHYDATTGTIGEFVKNFEGEANPAVMSLGMKKWLWVKTQMNDGKITTPKKADVFGLTFSKAGKVSVSTDCNGMGGNYSTQGKNIFFSQMISTMMYCDGSQEQEFSGALNEVSSYLFTSKGELILELKNDSGTMVFR